jgi:antitoxin VapB
MTTETTVFQSGNSQAVRLPRAFRFRSKKVEIFRRGDDVVLREKKRGLGEAFDLLAELAPAMGPQLKERRPPEERDWATLWGERGPKTRKSKR